MLKTIYFQEYLDSLSMMTAKEILSLVLRTGTKWDKSLFLKSQREQISHLTISICELSDEFRPYESDIGLAVDFNKHMAFCHVFPENPVIMRGMFINGGNLKVTCIEDMLRFGVFTASKLREKPRHLTKYLFYPSWKTDMYAIETDKNLYVGMLEQIPDIKTAIPNTETVARSFRMSVTETNALKVSEITADNIWANELGVFLPKCSSKSISESVLTPSYDFSAYPCARGMLKGDALSQKKGAKKFVPAYLQWLQEQMDDMAFEIKTMLCQKYAGERPSTEAVAENILSKVRVIARNEAPPKFFFQREDFHPLIMQAKASKKGFEQLSDDGSFTLELPYDRFLKDQTQYFLTKMLMVDMANTVVYSPAMFE